MFHFWKEDTPEARDFSTILVGLLPESTQGAADPNELLRIAAGIRAGNREDWTSSFQQMAQRHTAKTSTTPSTRDAGASRGIGEWLKTG